MGAREKRRRRRQAVARRLRTLFCSYIQLPMPPRSAALVSGTIGELGLRDLAFHFPEEIARQVLRLRSMRSA